MNDYMLVPIPVDLPSVLDDLYPMDVTMPTVKVVKVSWNKEWFTWSPIWASSISTKPLTLADLQAAHASLVTQAEPPTVELIDSSNPFAKVLDAWQTGKAGWTKKTLFRRIPQLAQLEGITA